jgi:hypothetical protein
MSDTPTNGAPVAAAPATETPKTETAAAPKVVREEPAYLADRLERERRSVLKQLGLKPEKGVPAQVAIEEAKKKTEGRKEALRAEKKRAEDAEARAATADKKLEALATYAKLELEALDEKTRETIKTLAGDDPAEQLKHLAAFKALAPKPAEPAIAAPKPAPANTTPAASAPLPAAASTELPAAERWAQIKSIQDPTQRGAMAAVFLLQHGFELFGR